MPEVLSNEVIGAENADSSFFTFMEVSDRLRRLSEGNKDLSVLSTDLGYLESEGTPSLIHADVVYPMKNFAFNQVQKLFGMSPTYFGNLNGEFRSDHLSYHLNHEPKPLILKVDHRNKIRGILTPEVANISNSKLFNQMLDDSPVNDYEISFFKANADVFEMRAALKTSFMSFEDGNDPIHLGFYLRNNEVNPKYLDFGLMVWQLSCSNGAVSTLSQHSGFENGFGCMTQRELISKFQAAVTYVDSLKETFKDNLVTLRETRFDAPLWKTLLKRASVTKGISGSLISKLNASYGNSFPSNGYELYSKITNISQGLSLGGRYQFDSIAGRMLFFGLSALGY